MRTLMIRLFALLLLTAVGGLAGVMNPVVAHAAPSISRCYQWCEDNWQEFTNACTEYYGYGDHGDPAKLARCRRMADAYYAKCNQEASAQRMFIPWRQEFPFPGGPHGL